MDDLLLVFGETKECDYKERHYSVRDNGSIFRHPKEGSRTSKLDNIWTFGTKDERTGYMLYGGVRVHQVVATAFHGSPIDQNMVVDHLDTNRCNNRPENLRWVTRLENVLNNPITRRRIEMLCGSIENFLKDPSKLRESASEPNTKWMRTVSKEEAAKCLKNLSRWAEEDNVLVRPAQSKKSEGIGEWIYNSSDDGFGESWDKDWHKRDYRSDYQKQIDTIEEENRRDYEEQYGLKDSLTPGALQLNWKVQTEFPLCPQDPSDTPLQDYLSNLKEGQIFCHNDVYESPVLKAGINETGQKIAVLCTTSNSVTNFALSEITFKDGKFIHENIRTFFTEDGAEKYYTLSLGREWPGADVMEDYC